MFKKELAILFTLAAVQFTNILDFMVMMPLAPQIIGEFDLTSESWGGLVASYTLAATVSSVLTLFFIDRLPRRTFLMIVYTGFLLGTLLCGISNSFNTLLGARVLAGLFGGGLGAVNMSIVGDVIENAKRGRAMGILMMGFSIASSLGVPIGLKISEFYGWNAPFVGVALVSILVLISIRLSVPKLDGHISLQTGVVSGIKEVFKDLNQLKAFFFMFCLILGHFLIIPFIAAYMEKNVGINQSDLFNIYLFGGIGAMITGVFTGKISDRIGKVKVFNIGVVLTCVPIFLITSMKEASLFYAIVISTMFFVFNTIRIVPGMALIVGAAPPKTRGVFMGIRSAIQMFASSMASLIAGFIVFTNENGYFENYDLLGYLAIGVSLLAILLVSRFKSIY